MEFDHLYGPFNVIVLFNDTEAEQAEEAKQKKAAEAAKPQEPATPEYAAGLQPLSTQTKVHSYTSRHHPSAASLVIIIIINIFVMVIF